MGDVMISYEEIKKIFIESNGIVGTGDLIKQGITIRHLNKLIDEDKLQRIKKGVYQLVEQDVEESVILFNLVPEAILCMESALYYHGYTDRAPNCFHIAVDRDSNKRKYKIDYPIVKPYYVEAKYLEIGLMEGEINDIKVRVYDKERTICDVLRFVNKMDREIFNKALQNYIKDDTKNIQRLIDYSKEFKVYNKMKMWIGVWL